MSRTRTVALLLLAAGCGKPDTPAPAPARPATTTPPPAAAAVSPPTPAQPATPAVDLPAATAAATKFLTWLPTGTLDLSAVAPEFQSTLAGDTGKLEWATEQYLRGFTGKGSPMPPTVSALPDGSVLAVAPSTPTAGRTVLRLAKAGDTWRAVWLHQGPVGPVPDLTGDPATLSVRFAVAAFVEPVLTNQPRLAEAALTAAGRTATAPPLGNDPLGFSRGILSQKLANFHGDATGYTLSTMPSGGRSVITGELVGPAGPGAGRKYEVVLDADGGQLRVAEFSPR